MRGVRSEDIMVAGVVAGVVTTAVGGGVGAGVSLVTGGVTGGVGVGASAEATVVVVGWVAGGVDRTICSPGVRWRPSWQPVAAAVTEARSKAVLSFMWVLISERR